MLLLAIALLQADFEKELAPVAKLIGRYEGKGQSGMGEYNESMSLEWSLGKTAIVLKSKSTAGEAVVFEDLRVFTYDATKKRIRCRQFAMGAVLTYTVTVKDDGKSLVMDDMEAEGEWPAAWRYTLTLGDGGFTYRVDAKERGEFRKYVSGALRKK